MWLALLAMVSLGVDTTNLWSDVPAELSGVTISKLDGKAASAASIFKRTTVVSFYTSIRGDSRDAKALDAIARELAGKADFEVLFVSIDLPQTAEDRAALAGLVKDMKVRLPIYVDDRLELLKWFNGRMREKTGKQLASNVMWSPTFVVVRDGQVVASSDADPRLSDDALRAKRKAKILEVLAQK